MSRLRGRAVRPGRPCAGRHRSRRPGRARSCSGSCRGWCSPGRTSPA